MMRSHRLSFVDHLELPSLQDPQLSPDEREKERLQDDVYAFEETNFKLGAHVRIVR